MIIMFTWFLKISPLTPYSLYYGVITWLVIQWICLLWLTTKHHLLQSWLGIKNSCVTQSSFWYGAALFTGVYAGDPAKLSMKAAFGKVWKLEQNGGSIIGGTIKAIQERNKNPKPPRDP